jgi:phosphatidylinositol alpha-1,6-mannosyltransferase
MRAIVVGEYRLHRGPDGNHYAESVFGRQFWDRYLNVFDEVLVVARVQQVSNVSGMIRVDGDRVSVLPLPYYIGPMGYAKKYLALRSAARVVSTTPGVLVLRVPGAVSSLVSSVLPKGRTYGVEVVGDPADVLTRGVVDHPLRVVLRWRAIRSLRHQCVQASAVAYVSRYQLQERYPPGQGRPTFSYSSATMPPEAFVDAPKKYDSPLTRLISIGSMEQLYKGFDTLLQAFLSVRVKHPSAHLTLVGGGRHLADLQNLSIRLGLGEAVTFTGALSTPIEVRTHLDQADLFVSASRTEGLPRTVIEAQARGLAVLGTEVGSTPDLLPSSRMCPPNAPEALAAMIASTLSDPGNATVNATEGWANSFRFSADRLQVERDAMYTALSLRERDSD